MVDALLRRQGELDPHVLELVVVLALIAIVAAVSLVFLGDAIADLISLIGGHVDDATLLDRTTSLEPIRPVHIPA